MAMVPPRGRVRFRAVRNNGGVDLTVIVGGRILAVIRLSASELEDMVRAIDDALNHEPHGDGNGPAGDAE